MKNLRIDYSLTSKQRAKQLLLSVCSIIAGVVIGYFAYKTGSNLLMILISIYIFFCIVFLIGQSLLGYKKYIALNVDVIEEKLSYWAFPLRINWKDVRKITLGITNVDIELNSKKVKKINLAKSSYSDIKNIKYHFFAFCLEKKIPCHVKAVIKKIN